MIWGVWHQAAIHLTKPSRSVISEREIYFAQNFFFFFFFKFVGCFFNYYYFELFFSCLPYKSQMMTDRLWKFEETWRQELHKQNIQDFYPVKLHVNIVKKIVGWKKFLLCRSILLHYVTFFLLWQSEYLKNYISKHFQT